MVQLGPAFMDDALKYGTATFLFGCGRMFPIWGFLLSNWLRESSQGDNMVVTLKNISTYWSVLSCGSKPAVNCRRQSDVPETYGYISNLTGAFNLRAQDRETNLADGIVSTQ